MTLYEELKEIAETERERTAGRNVAFFTHYQEDLYKLDHDELVNESQAGDTYIWVLKSNGCGTYLVRCNGSDVPGDVLSTLDEACQFYRIRCTGVNEGDIRQITRDAAQEIAKTTKEPEGRVPRRVEFFNAMHDLLGINPRQHTSLRATKLKSLVPEDRDATVFLELSRGPESPFVYQLRAVRAGRESDLEVEAPKVRMIDLRVAATPEIMEMLGEAGGEKTAFKVDSKAGAAGQIYGVVGECHPRTFSRRWTKTKQAMEADRAAPSTVATPEPGMG